MAFNFLPIAKTLTICDHEFTINVGDVTALEKLDNIRQEYSSKLKELSTSGKQGEFTRAFCIMVEKQLDVVLGEGSYKKIFADRPLNFVEHNDIMDYILSESYQLREERKSIMLGSNKEAEVVG
jgi:hypothetical protein